jgi:hypothetical protein
MIRLWLAIAFGIYLSSFDFPTATAFRNFNARFGLLIALDNCISRSRKMGRANGRVGRDEEESIRVLSVNGWIRCPK